jgi:hypothetical protein
VKNFRYVEKTSAECNEDSYLAILHLSRVELHCKLQEKLHRVTWPKGPYTPDAIRQRDAIFRFLLTDNFDSSLNFPNI